MYEYDFTPKIILNWPQGLHAQITLEGRPEEDHTKITLSLYLPGTI